MRRAVVGAVFAVAACATPRPLDLAGPELLAPGVVSTAASEWNATATADGRTLVFARSQESSFENAGIWIARGRAGAWTGAAPIDFTRANRTDSDPQISADGRQLIFVTNRPAPGTPPGAPPKRDLDIWSSTLSEGRWSDPRPLPTVNSAGPELGPEIHEDVLFFNSVRRGGQGALDIWSAPVSGARFGDPRPLPAPLNSPSSEGDFTLHRNGRLALFWSDRPGGLGQGDIYLSVLNAEGWATPVNLGAPVNSPAFDFTPSFSADGRWLTFASMRRRADGSDAQSDLYRIAVESVPALRDALAGG
jgi:Tol biopolymer transport system component